MLPTRAPLCALLFVAAACASSPEAEPPAEFNVADMVLPTPVEQHTALLADVGTWEGTLTSYMPGAPSDPVWAKEELVAVGGFWTQSRFQCDFMGELYIGTGCTGYLPDDDVYVGTWVDSMSTYLAVMEGQMKDGALVMHWRAPAPTGEMALHRSETVHEGDTRTMTFYMGEGDAAVKTMVIELKRSGG